VASEEGARQLEITEDVPVDGPMWIAARARGDKQYKHGFRSYPLWAHTSAVYVEAPGKLPGADDARHFIGVTQEVVDEIEGQDFEDARAKAQVLDDLNKAIALYENRLKELR